MAQIYINGVFHDKEHAKVSVFDHGLLYGDGVFEGIRAYDGLIFKLEEHIDRLYESAHTILLKIPMTRKQMIDAVVQTVKHNKLKDAYIRLVVTRGEGDLGLDPRKCTKHTVIIIADKIKLYADHFYKRGMELITVPTQRNFTEALNPQIKSLNYLNNIMAKIEAVSAGYEEAIMLNKDGFVAECTGDNIFIIKDNILYTPPGYMGVLKGITRQAVIEIALKKKMVVKEAPLTRHDLFNADECFLTGTAAEIIPILKIDGRIIGPGEQGEWTKKLRKAFKQIVKTDGVRVK